jgi:hypothetical protein
MKPDHGNYKKARAEQKARSGRASASIEESAIQQAANK